MQSRNDRQDHLDEGAIHAWLDGALAPDESAAIEAHVAECEACAASVAEARGLMAAASRVLSALDDIPAGVIPGSRDESGAPRDQLAMLRARHAEERAAGRRRWWRNGQMVAAASVVFMALGTATVFWRGSFRADAVPGAARVELESQPTIASDAVAPTPPPAAPVPVPTPMRGAAAAGESIEKKVASPPADSAAANVTAGSPRVSERDTSPPQRLGAIRDEARQRADVAPSAPPPQAQQLQGLQRQSGAGQQTQQMNYEIRQEAQRRAKEAAKVGQAQMSAAEPAAQPVVASLAIVGCYELSPVPEEMGARRLPARLRLDSAAVRSAGDTTWYRAIALGVDSASVLEWRRVDATTIELARLDAGGATGVGAREQAGPVTRVALMSGTDQARALRDVVPPAAARAAPTNETRAARPGAGAVRIACPR